MKTAKILKLTGVALIGVVLFSSIEAGAISRNDDEKKTVVLKVSQPVIKFVANMLVDQVDSDTVAWIQKVLGQIDQVTVSFRPEGPMEAELKIEPSEDQILESWMFNEGYLDAVYETEMETPVPWMENMRFESGVTAEEVIEAPVPWMENMHFESGVTYEEISEAPVPWMENMHFE